MLKHLLFSFLLFTTFCYGQNLRHDTTYYNSQGLIVEPGEENEIEKYRVYSYSGRKLVSQRLFLHNNLLIESTQYKKDLPHGRYYSWSPQDSIRINGEFRDGQKFNTWTYEDFINDFKTITEYNKNGTIIGKDARLGEKTRFYRDNGIVYAMHPNGYEYWLDYLRRNLRYPETMTGHFQSSIIKVEVFVLANGRIIQINYPNEGAFPRGLLQNLSKLIHGSVDWQPASLDGKAVNSVTEFSLYLPRK